MDEKPDECHDQSTRLHLYHLSSDHQMRPKVASIPNIISALRILGAICLLLFLAVPTMFWSIIPLAVVAGIATFAAIQEGHFIRTGRV